MAKYLFRVSLVHTEPTQAKSRTKNLGTIAQMETNSPREARAEIERLQAMTSRDSWQIPTQLVVERSEVSDFVPVDVDTLEPARNDESPPDSMAHSPDALAREE